MKVHGPNGSINATFMLCLWFYSSVVKSVIVFTTVILCFESTLSNPQHWVDSIMREALGKCFPASGQVENAEVQKPKYRNGSTGTELWKWEEKLSVIVQYLSDSQLCLVAQEWLSPSAVRAGYWDPLLQQTLTQSFSVTQVKSCLRPGHPAMRLWWQFY